MKVAIPSLGPNLESPISPSFARAPFFIIVEVENGEIKNHEVVNNQAMSVPAGAAILVTNMLVSKKVEAVVCFNIGRRAFELLTQAGIKIFRGTGTVKDLAIKAEKGELPG